MLTCKDVSYALAADALPTAGWRRRLGIRLHLLMCDGCRRFAQELAALGETARQVARTAEPSPSEIAQTERLLARLANTMRTGEV